MYTIGNARNTRETGSEHLVGPETLDPVIRLADTIRFSN